MLVAYCSIARYKSFKDFNKRIMVATDIFGRGIDIERVNIVINYDMPDGADSYLHRVGRAGRFGTKGLAISFVAGGTDAEVLNKVQERFEVQVNPLVSYLRSSVTRYWTDDGLACQPDTVEVSTYMAANTGTA